MSSASLPIFSPLNFQGKNDIVQNLTNFHSNSLSLKKLDPRYKNIFPVADTSKIITHKEDEDFEKGPENFWKNIKRDKNIGLILAKKVLLYGTWVDMLYNKLGLSSKPDIYLSKLFIADILPEILQKLDFYKDYSKNTELKFLTYLQQNLAERKMSFRGSVDENFAEIEIKIPQNNAAVISGWGLNDKEIPTFKPVDEYINDIVKRFIDIKYKDIKISPDLKKQKIEYFKIIFEESVLENSKKEYLNKKAINLYKIGFNTPSHLLSLLVCGFCNKNKVSILDNTLSFEIEFDIYLDDFIKDFKQNYRSFFDKNEIKAAKIATILNHRKEINLENGNNLLSAKYSYLYKRQESKNVFSYPKNHESTFMIIDQFYGYHVPMYKKNIVSLSSFLNYIFQGYVISLNSESQIDPLRGKYIDKSDDQLRVELKKLMESVKETSAEQTMAQNIHRKRAFYKKWFGVTF